MIRVLRERTLGRKGKMAHKNFGRKRKMLDKLWKI